MPAFVSEEEKLASEGELKDLPESTLSVGLTFSQDELLTEYFKGSNFNYLSSRSCELKPKNSNLMDFQSGGVGPITIR